MIIVFYDHYRDVLKMERVVQLSVPKPILIGLQNGEISFFSLNVNFPRKRRSVLSVVRSEKYCNAREPKDSSNERLLLTKRGLEERIGFECVDALRREKVKFLQIASKLVNGEVKLVKLAIYY